MKIKVIVVLIVIGVIFFIALCHGIYKFLDVLYNDYMVNVIERKERELQIAIDNNADREVINRLRKEYKKLKYGKGTNERI